MKLASRNNRSRLHRIQAVPMPWVDALLDYSRGTRLGLALRLISKMGLMQKEVRILRVRDFKVDEAILLVGGSFPRVVSVPDDCLLPLLQFAQGRDGEEFLIPGLGGNKPIGARSLQSYLRKILPRVLGPGRQVSIRELRETCILDRIIAGSEPEVVKKEFGIVTDATMQGYIASARES